MGGEGGFSGPWNTWEPSGLDSRRPGWPSLGALSWSQGSRIEVGQTLLWQPRAFLAHAAVVGAMTWTVICFVREPEARKPGVHPTKREKQGWHGEECSRYSALRLRCVSIVSLQMGWGLLGLPPQEMKPRWVGQGPSEAGPGEGESECLARGLAWVYDGPQQGQDCWRKIVLATLANTARLPIVARWHRQDSKVHDYK